MGMPTDDELRASLERFCERHEITCAACGLAGAGRKLATTCYCNAGIQALPVCRECFSREVEHGNVTMSWPVSQPNYVREVRDILSLTAAAPPGKPEASARARPPSRR